jgi:hypothetical protein
VWGVILGEWRGEEPAERDIPGARPAAVELLRPGWGKRGEGKAGILGCTMVAMRGAPLGINSLAAGFGAFLLCDMLRAPKSLNSDDVGEFTGSAGGPSRSGVEFWWSSFG